MFTLRTILQLFLSGQRKNSRKFESLLWISNFPSCEYKMYIAVKNGDWSAVKIAEGEVKSWDRGLNIQMNFLEERFAQDRPRRKGRRIVELSRRWLPHLSERLLGTVFRNFEFPDSLLFSLTLQLTLSLSLSLSLARMETIDSFCEIRPEPRGLRNLAVQLYEPRCSNVQKSTRRVSNNNLFTRSRRPLSLQQIPRSSLNTVHVSANLLSAAVFRVDKCASKSSHPQAENKRHGWLVDKRRWPLCRLSFENRSVLTARIDDGGTTEFIRSDSPKQRNSTRNFHRGEIYVSNMTHTHTRSAYTSEI